MPTNFCLTAIRSSQEIIHRHEGKTAIYSLIRGIIRSPEFQNISAGKLPLAGAGFGPTRMCDENEFFVAYNLLLHRNPDKQSLEGRAEMGRKTVDIVRQILGSREFSEIEAEIWHPS